MNIECPNCHKSFEHVGSGREKDKYGFALNTLGSEIALMAIEEKKTGDEIKRFLFKREHNMHEGRVNQTLYLLRKNGFLEKPKRINK